MPLPISTILLIIAGFVIFWPSNTSVTQILGAIILLLVAFINESLRLIFRRLPVEKDFYDIPAAPQEPIAHRDVPE